MPDKKLYKTDEIKDINYIEFISRIYNYFRSIERQQLYEFQVKHMQWEDDITSYTFNLCALRPFKGGCSGYKRGGGSGTFGMRIFLTNRKLLLNQLNDLDLPEKYKDIGIKFIIEEHPYFLKNIDEVVKHIKNVIDEDCIGKLIDDNYYDLQERDMEFEELKEKIITNINKSNYNLTDFTFDIKGKYNNRYFTMNNKYLGQIVKLTQREKTTIEYFLDIE